MRSLFVFCIAVTMAIPAVAQAEAMAFPSQQRNWLNSDPMTLDAIKGKAAVLWFFEEQ